MNSSKGAAVTLFIGGHMDGRDVNTGGRSVVDFAVAPPIAICSPPSPARRCRRESYQRRRYIVDGAEIAVYVLVGLDPD